ncbi:MAG: hypothetical protein WDN25_03855 [Acetobacteraceae bacterium]
MEGHFFCSRRDPGLNGFALDPAGKELPERRGPWEHIGQGSHELLNEAATAAIELERVGYHLFRSHIGVGGPFGRT